LKTEIYISLVVESVPSIVSQITAATLLRRSASAGASVGAAVLRDTIKRTHV
jgi:hypothetical protein